jgi:hypothetical protein
LGKIQIVPALGVKKLRKVALNRLLAPKIGRSVQGQGGRLMTGVAAKEDRQDSAKIATGEAIHFTVFTAEKPTVLSKTYSRSNDGALKKHPAPGMLLQGNAETLICWDVNKLAEVLDRLGPENAVCWGRMSHGRARIVTKKSLGQIEPKHTDVPVIARSRENFAFRGTSGMMFDHDGKRSEDELIDGMKTIFPEIETGPYIIRPSASSYIYDKTSGEMLCGLSGLRLILIVKDGVDIPRAAEVLNGRAWLHGFGRYEISKSGSLLERNELFDMSVFQPERLDFCGGALCEEPLEQRLKTSRVLNHANPLNTRAVLPDLTSAEKQKIAELKKDAKEAARPQAEEIKNAWIDERIQEQIAQRLELTDKERCALAERFNAAVKHSRLYGDFEIALENGATVTVGQILDDPGRYHNMRCADPLEPGYRNDRRIAWINLYAAARPYIFSHAHGGRRFTLVRVRATTRLIAGERFSHVQRVLELLRLDGQIYLRGDELVQVDDDGRIIPLNGDALILAADRTVAFEKLDGRTSDWVRTDCPMHIGKGMMAARNLWNFPKLLGTATAPAYDPATGRVIDADGYDEGTSLMLVLNNDQGWPGVPPTPTLEQCETALDQLYRPFASFPLNGVLDEAVLLAAILTASVRPLLPTAPGFAFTAPTAGSGKTLMALALSAIAGSETPAVIPASDQGEETRKMLLSFGRTGTPVLLLDNIVGYFDSTALCAYLTSPFFSDRILGQTQYLQIPTTQLFLLTGNNLTLKGDLCRRVLSCTIDPQVEAPWTRSFSLHPAEYCKEHRYALLAAAYTLMRAARNAGATCPDRTGSFEMWSDTVRATILWLTTSGLQSLPDPVQSIADAFESDPETAKLTEVLQGWRACYGSDAKTVAQIIKDSPNNGDHALRETLDLIAGERGNINPRRLGAWIMKNQGRIVNGLRFRDSRCDCNGAKRWLVEQCA